MPRKRRSSGEGLEQLKPPVALSEALQHLPIADDITAEAPPAERKPYERHVQGAFEQSYSLGDGERMHTRYSPQYRQFQIKFDKGQDRTIKDKMEQDGFRYHAKDRNGGEDQVWAKQMDAWPSYQEREDFKAYARDLANFIRQEKGFEPSISL